VGDGARGLLGRRRRVGLLSARSRPQSRLPLGRRRAARAQRPAGAAVLCAFSVEWARSDPEGAAVRADGTRGQPRRGREGVLLLPRRDADAFVRPRAVQVSAGGVPVRRAGRRKPPAHSQRRRVRADRHRHFRRAPLLRRADRVRQGRAGRRAARRHDHEPRARRRDAAPPADAVVPQHVVLGARGRGVLAEAAHRARRGAGASGQARLAGRDAALLRALPGRAGAGLHGEREQREAPLERGRRPCEEGRVPPVRRRGAYGRAGGRFGNKGGGLLPAGRAGRGRSEGPTPAERGRSGRTRTVRRGIR